MMTDKNLEFNSMEETISFYTRNDFAIINSYLLSRDDEMWERAKIAYGDNQGILEEFRNGTRKVSNDYDVKWINALNKRLIGGLDADSKKKILEIAKKDANNILSAMKPADKDLLLYRTSWENRNVIYSDSFPFSLDYLSLELKNGMEFDIQTFSSCSLTPYREDENHSSAIYRYEITVAKGLPVLELDSFCTHNESGEVVLPPARFLVKQIKTGNGSCKGIIELEYIKPLELKLNL